MRILQVITSLDMGGAETLVVNLIPRLQALGHTADLCVFDGTETPLTHRLKKESPQTKIFALGHGVYNPLYILKLVKIMKNYDIIHTHNSSPQLFVAIASLFSRTNIVSTEHNTSNRKRNWKWYRPIESWMYGRYNHVICISKIAEEKLREYMGGKWLVKSSNKYKSITTINNGIDVNAISKAEPCKELLNLKESRKSILMVAGFRKQKNQDTIIRALTLLDKEKYEVWFAGIGERMEEVKQLALSLGVSERVRFLGLRTDIPNVLRASDVNGLKEVTKGYGILFPHEDAKALAEEINQLASDEAYYNEIAERCYNRALEFDIQRMTNGYETVYNNVISL